MFRIWWHGMDGQLYTDDLAIFDSWEELQIGLRNFPLEPEEFIVYEG